MNLNIYNPYVRHDIELMHYGVKGMKWGKHKMLPYPYPSAIGQPSPVERMLMNSRVGNGSPRIKPPVDIKLPLTTSLSRSYSTLAESRSKEKEKDKDKEKDKEKDKDEKSKKEDSKDSDKKSKKKGRGKKSSGGSGKKAKATEDNTQKQTVEVEEPINVKRKTHVNYSIDTRMGQRQIPSGAGNVRMTDMHGNAVNGPSGLSTGSMSRPTSGRMKLTKEESDREYEAEVANVRRQRATQKALKTVVSSTSTTKIQAGKEIADKVLKKKSK